MYEKLVEMILLKIDKEARDKDISLGKLGQLAELSENTIYNWYNKGEDAKSGKFKKFYDKVEEAKSVAITLRARRIYKAGETSWQADAWWLERVDPDNFGRKDHIDINSKSEITHNGFQNLIEAFDESKREWDKHKQRE